MDAKKIESGERIFCRIFGIRDGKSPADIKNTIRKFIKKLIIFDVKMKSITIIVKRLKEYMYNGDANAYIQKLTEGNNGFQTIKNLVDVINPQLNKVEENVKKLVVLNPLISFLSDECNKIMDDSIKKFIQQIKELQNDDCHASTIIKTFDTSKENDITNLLSINSLNTISSNVFYRILIKKLFEKGEIKSPNELFNNLLSIEENCKHEINIDFIKSLKINEFKDEIIKKTQELMMQEKSQYASNEIKVANLVYQRIESNYLEFSDLSDDDKEFLHLSIIHIVHYDDFNNLGLFFKRYFESKNDFEPIKSLINPLKNESTIREFQKFSTSCESHDKDEIFSNSTLEEFKDDFNWPRVSAMGIKIEQVSQFFTFWCSINQLISLFMNDSSHESIFVPSISNFLSDKNLYIQFQKKMLQAYIEPSIKNVYAIFESVMKMLNASDIANSSNFKTVSKNAATFFFDYPPELYTVSGGFNSLLNNEKKIIELFDNEKANVVIEEYEYVKKVINRDCYWEISYDNHIQLISNDPKGKIVANFAKLRLIAAKLNIVMIKTENISKLDEYKNSDNFVKFFQISESLYEKISILHKLNFDFANKVFKYELLNCTEIKDLISNFDTIIRIINEKFVEVYKDEICLFTKEQFFKLYHLINRFFEKNEKSSDLISIFEGAIISTIIERPVDPINDYYNIIKKEKLKYFNLDENINDKNIKNFTNSLTDFSNILSKIIKFLMKDRKMFNEEYFKDMEIKGNLLGYLTGGTVRCINCNYISHKPEKPQYDPKTGNLIKDKKFYFSSKYQLHSMILYLLKLYRSDNYTSLPIQILICSMSVTLSQIDSFFKYFDYKSSENKEFMFIIVSPIQLQPSLFDYMVSKLKKINESIISQCRIIILYENSDLKKKKAFEEVIRHINVDSFNPVIKTQSLKNFYQARSKETTYGIQAYYIYEQFPRTGKTHTILQHIYTNYPDHIYTRILVDESTSLPTLISRLNEIAKIDNKNKSIIIHFNVDGKCSTNFHLYMQNLAIFRSLNDGVSIPFLVNNNMVFYFEFGSCPSYNKEGFIQNVFPIADYIEEIKIPNKTNEFFTYDEYLTVPHDEIPEALKVSKHEKYRKYLIEAATIAKLDQDKTSFMKTDKSALYVKYKDYIDYYKRFYKELESNPSNAYKYLLNMFNDIENVPKGYKVPLISQINDVSKVIAKFKGPILSQTVYETEKGVGYNVRRFLVGLIIEAAITNCGLPYMPPIDESTEKDQERLDHIQAFITRGHMLAVCNPAGTPEYQSFALINNEDEDFDKLLKKFNYYVDDKKKYDDIKNAIKSALKVVDAEWRKNTECPDELFKLFANILNLEENEKYKYNIALLVNTWRSFDDESREVLQEEWKDNINDVKVRKRSENIKKIYKENNPDPNFKRRKDFWEQIQNDIHDKSLFDLSDDKNNQNDKNIISVSDDIYAFISNCEKYIQNENSLMLKYTLTPQNIMRFIHLVYRIYSNVPIVLMGETGSGKTFTLNFLAEIIGKNVEFIKRVIDGGTKEEDIRAFLKVNIRNLTAKRSNKLKEDLAKIAKDKGTPDIIAKAINSLPIKEEDKNVFLTGFDDIKDKLESFIDDLDMETLSKNYDVFNEEEREGLKKFVLFYVEKKCKQIETEQKSYLFFFDEVNTAPCQWFIKEIILDRYFEGAILPNYIHFVCAVNPSRHLNNNIGQSALDALDPVYFNDSQDERRNLVYKVVQMPESFVPYLFPADPNRDYGSYSDSKKKKSNNEYLFDIEINSEFDVSIDKKVESEFSMMTYPFVTAKSNDNEYKKKGDCHHFSFTDMFSTSFDFAFFNSIAENPKKALVYSRSIPRLLSRINIFCCRFSFNEIYKDKSFSSIRDPERCIQIMRWAYKFGIFKKLQPNLSFEKSMKRLRKAFIIGLSVSFWIRLSDKKSGNEESHRTLFIRNVCKYWVKLLKNWKPVSELKKFFKAPNEAEWREIIQKEYRQYADIFVDDDECVSKNEALSENIWISYICIMNNIALWIIGKPGTSKSLALNIVINKLMNQNSTSEKITKCPHLVSQTFMCSNTTTAEAIMDQLGKIVERANMYNDNYVIRIQILEEIGHADMSRFKPLVCLHNIIDNGYSVAPDVFVPVQLIGLSNYKMDSAKLNRGILLLRCSLNDDEMKKTAIGIFESTNLAWHHKSKPTNKSLKEIDKYKNKIEAIGENYQTIYNNSNIKTEQPFIGLRDFYGLIQSITKPICSGSISQEEIFAITRRNFSGIPPSMRYLNNERTYEMIAKVMKILFDDDDYEFDDSNFQKLLLKINNNSEDNEGKENNQEDLEKVTAYYNMTSLIQSNISQDHHLLKTPIFRHILISTINAAAVFILVQNKILQFTNYQQDSPYELFFANNMSNLPDAEWISNELRRLTEVMYHGDKTAIFIGKHPCFDSLYDIFNLRYQKEGFSDDNNETFVAMISYCGDSYPTLVSSNFKVIIILESDIYKDLPQPFLNRFEKFNLTYETELLPSVRSEIKKNIRTIKKYLQKDLSSVFGCYSDELLLSIYYIIDNSSENLTVDDILFLSIRPGDLIYSTKNDISYSNEIIECALKENSMIRSSLAHLLYGYKQDYKGDFSVSAYLYKMWKKNYGIKSIVMVPSFNNIEKITGYDFIFIDSLNMLDIESRIKNDIIKIEKESVENKEYKPIVISILISRADTTIDLILQYEYILETIHRWSYDVQKIKKRPVHTLIIISMEHKYNNLKINQSTEWPLIYLDSCYDNIIKMNNNDGLPLGLEQLVFTPLKELVDDGIIDIEELIQSARKAVRPCYTKQENELIDRFLFEQDGNFKFYILDIIKALIQKDNDDLSVNIEIISSNFTDYWSSNKITLLSSPPSSLIQYLSIKLIDAIGDIMGIIFELLLSGLNPGDLLNIQSDIFKRSEIFYFMMDRPEFSGSFFWIFNRDSTQAYPIDYRYSFDVDSPQIPGQLSFYKFVWQKAEKIYSTENVNTPDELFEKLKNALFPSDDNDLVYALFNDLMTQKLDSSEDSFCFPFIAAYLLVIASSVRVDQDFRETFSYWISCYIEILKGLFIKEKKLTMKFMMFHLVSNKDLIDFTHNFTIPYMFFPFPKRQQNSTINSLKKEEKQLFAKLISPEVAKDLADLPESYHIHTEEAYLLADLISPNFLKTINKLGISIFQANNLFRNEFTSLLLINNSLLYCSDFVNGYDYTDHHQYFPFLMSIQYFFIKFGDILIENLEKDVQNKFTITDTGNFSMEEVVIDSIPIFVRKIAKNIKIKSINEDVFFDMASSTMMGYYLECINNIYIGLIDVPLDNFNDDEEEEEEEEEEKEEKKNVKKKKMK